MCEPNRICWRIITEKKEKQDKAKHDNSNVLFIGLPALDPPVSEVGFMLRKVKWTACIQHPSADLVSLGALVRPTFSRETHPSETMLNSHTPIPTEQSCPSLNMDITGHFESASCVIEVDGSATLAQLKGKLLAELGVSSARRFSVRMRGGGDIGKDDLRICDTEMDEGCAVELYCTGANITRGVIRSAEETSSLTLSPCDRYLAVVWRKGDMSIFDTETHESLCRFPCAVASSPAFSPCSGWISCLNLRTQCAEVHDVKTGALEHSFGEACNRQDPTSWSPCGTKLLLCQSKGLQVWDIATGVVVHEWDHIVDGDYAMVVTGDRVAMFSNDRNITIWDYTTGVEVLVLTCPSDIHDVALSPNELFIAACGTNSVLVWNIETGERVFEDVSENEWTDVAVSNDVVAAYLPTALAVWSISTGEQLLLRRFAHLRCYGVAMSNCGGVVMYGNDEGIQMINLAHLS